MAAEPHVTREGEVIALQAQLAELQGLFEGIRQGGVDAVLIGEPGSEQIYTLAGAEGPFKLIVEQMNQGALTVSPRQVILFANRRFGEMVGLEAPAIVGKPISTFLDASSRAAVDDLLSVPAGDAAVATVHLVGADGARPVSLSASSLVVDGLLVRCLIATEVTSTP
jgi:PAS domain S-box-containing protein